ncbi:MAG: M12 family metallo-peptidase [Candidatus Thiodiazotropha taylori]|nr:M12 family metallo-peptidase [Candidatus Thiodiazotropha taylori]MCG7924230.1 M12 family metallo-peptidase [Candidatus Thiodiazotropha taylori]MCG7936464.1 M12 family metallo-peptidase [Candidatus Thiodiazotropha taylori]MCG7970268.1 M12 family metallo-peptidase [Candidatus Thiodiazotropha taylori]
MRIWHSIKTHGWLWSVVLLPLIAEAGIWRDLPSPEYAARSVVETPRYYRALEADLAALRAQLSQAPAESGLTIQNSHQIILPLPGGEMVRCWIEQSPVMAASLAERYPEIATYRVRGVDNPELTGRLDLTPRGFHAMLTGPSGTIYIDPDPDGHYRSFYKADYAKSVGIAESPPVCQLGHHISGEPLDARIVRAGRQTHSSDQRRIYRLAVAATGEYSAYFGGSVTETLAQIVTAINRVNQIYGRDLAIQFQLVGNNDRIIYTDASSDPYTHTPSGIPTMLTENQQNLDFTLGADSYDIGHLFGILGGGLASVGSVCQSFKAQAYTGTSEPDNDVFYIDFVAHELGHQLNANHTFNGTSANCGGVNRVGIAAVEPGSGSTIMSYAGICGDENLQSNSDATFHALSIEEMGSYINQGSGRLCGTLVSTGNRAPLVDAGKVGEDGVHTIPAGTPFRLTGQAEDPDEDSISYQWDEMDAGGEGGATDGDTIGTDIDQQNNPLFRSFLPTTTPDRYLPRLTTLLAGSQDIGETLPTSSRQLNFRLTVRDGESGVASDDLVIDVDDSSGSFQITGGSLNSGGRFNSGSSQSINWSTGGTDQSCPEVVITLMSLDASDPPVNFCDDHDPGMTILNLGRYPNTGAALVDLPDVTLQQGRLMLVCADGLFFNLSGQNFSIQGGSQEIASDCKPLDGTTLQHGTLFTDAGGATKFDSPGGGGLLWLLNLMLGVVTLVAIRDRIDRS